MKQNVSIKLTVTVFFSFVFIGLNLFAQDLQKSNQSWSDQLINIESDQVGNQIFVHAENHLTNQIFNQSKNKTIISAMLAERLDAETIIQKQLLTDKSEIILVDHGLGKSIDFNQKINGVTKKLLSNLDIKKNNSVAFISFSISPDEKIAVVFSEQNGSIDDYQLYVVDLTKAQTISTELTAKGNSIVWTSPSKFSYTDTTNRNKQIEVDILNNFSKVEYAGIKFLGNYPVLMKCESDIQKAILDGSQEIVLKGLTCSNWTTRARHRLNEITVITNASNNHHEILRYSVKPTDTVIEPNKIFEFDGVLQQAQFIDNHYFLQISWGPEQKLIVLDEAGILLQTIPVPAFASIRLIQAKTLGSSISVTLDSIVMAGQVFELDYTSGKWIDPVTEGKLLRKTNIQYASEILMITARDGVQIPLRLTRLASTKMDESTPVLLEVYGGFDIVGKIYPQFNPAVRNLFLNKGGVYATPAIRGGGEYGDHWYDSATGLNKLVSLNDIIDVTQFLIRKKWTAAKKIIMTGTSNGGFSVMAAALLSPESFGLVIPVNGVYDILSINRLDPRFARGWWKDYGNPSVPIYAEAINKFSPLEIDLPTVEKLPHFLFVNGLNDSRVNSLHSIKMIKKLRLTLGATDKVNALFLKNAGHWIASQNYQDYIALRENSIVWDFVYKQLGW